MTTEQTLAALGATATVVTFLVTGTDWLIRKWLQKHRDELINQLNTRVHDLHDELDDMKGERDKARAEHAAAVQLQTTTADDLAKTLQRSVELSAEVAAHAAELQELQGVKEELDKKQKTHDNRIRRALELEGQLWTQKVMTGTPKFVPLGERKTPIVSVLNLKGGVGKTTLTANLAWALSARGYRVLLLDLDLQGSLSSLFLRNDELARIAREERGLVQHFIDTAHRKETAKLSDFALPVPQLNKHCRLVAASDHLAYAELSQTVRWLLRVGSPTQQWNGRHDGRMILRRALHAKGLYKKFDVVLMDCPPLINLCCANALAASDYVLTPVTPSVKAIERVVPLLERVKEIKSQGVNPDLNPLGVVANRTDKENGLTPREQDLFLNLPAQCLKVFGTSVERFATNIQQRAAIRDGEEFFQAPDESHPLRETFEALANEFIGRLPGHCRKPEDRNRKSATTGEKV